MKEAINHSQHLQAYCSTAKKRVESAQKELLGLFVLLILVPRNYSGPQAGENRDSSVGYIGNIYAWWRSGTETLQINVFLQVRKQLNIYAPDRSNEEMLFYTHMYFTVDLWEE